jgi:UDP-N-acetylmuramate dehydrogenase
MDNNLKLIADSFGPDLIKFNEPLSLHCELKVGGPAKLFFVAVRTQEIIRMVEMARGLKVPVFIFGSGSKMMMSDQGFEGVVIKNRTKNIKVVSIKGKVSKTGIGVSEAMVEIDSGMGISRLATFLDKEGLQSDDLAGITGTLGGGLFINRTLQDKTKSVKVIEDQEIIEIEPRELSLRKHVILSAVLKFKSKQ